MKSILNKFLLLVTSILLTACIQTKSGTTVITPINVSNNGFIFKSMTVTATRNFGINNSNVVAVGNINNILKYSVIDKGIYDKIISNIGKPIEVEYTVDMFYLDPKIENDYVITGLINK